MDRLRFSLPQNSIEKFGVLLMNWIVSFSNFVPNGMAYFGLIQKWPNFIMFLLDYGWKCSNPIFYYFRFGVLDLMVEVQREIECNLLMTHYTNIYVLEEWIGERGCLGAGVQTRRTVPTMRHLHWKKDMSEILAPFYHWRTVTFTLDDLFLHKFQSVQLFLKD